MYTKEAILKLDIATLVFVTSVLWLCQTAALIVQYRIAKVYPGMFWWLVAVIVQTAGFWTMLTVLFPPVYVLAMFGNPLMYLGQIFLTVGILKFLDRPVPVKLLLLIYILFLVSYYWFLFGNNHLSARTAVCNVFIGCMSLLSAYYLFRRKKSQFAGAANFTSLVFFCFALVEFLLFLILIFSLSYFKYSEVNQHPVALLNYIAPIISSVLWTYGLILLVNQRLTADVQVEKEKLRLIFNIGPQAEFITRMSDSRIIDANNEQSTLTGYSIQEVLGKNMLDLNLWVQPEDRASYIDELIRHGAVNQREFVFRRGDGRMFVGLTSGRLIHIEDQQHVVTSILDITGRKEMEQKMQAVLAEKDAQYQTLSQIQDQLLKMNGELERLSAQDKLTGYFNRHKLTEMLEHEIFRWSRYGHSSTLVLVDIDHFKQINDRFGHLAGDKVLVDLSALLQANVRKTDLCFRWGGEEFLFLLTETEYLQAMRTAEKLRRVVETCSDFPVGSLTISLGVVTWREGWSYEEWIQQADQALYEAKEQGRNRVVGKTPQE